MLRTTHRSRKTLKQRGGATWVEDYGHGKTRSTPDKAEPDIDIPIRANPAAVNSVWTQAIDISIEDRSLPASLKGLGLAPNATVEASANLQTFIDAHRYQDELLRLAILIAKSYAIYKDTKLDKATFNKHLELSDAIQQIDMIIGKTNELAAFFAQDVFKFLNFTVKPTTTNRIEYIFQTWKIDNSDIFLQPHILINTFIYGLANSFIMLKYKPAELNQIKAIADATNKKKASKLFGRYLRNYVHNQATQLTGSGIAGSFYLNQEYTEGGSTETKGTFKDLFYTPDRTTPEIPMRFFNTLVYSLATVTTSTIGTADYKAITERATWITLFTDIFLEYVAQGTNDWTYQTFLQKMFPTDTAAAAAVPPFFPPGTESLKIEKTDITPTQLLTRLSPESFSSLVHFLTVLKHNEKKYYAALPTTEQEAFKGTFGAHITAP